MSLSFEEESLMIWADGAKVDSLTGIFLNLYSSAYVLEDKS